MVKKRMYRHFLWVFIFLLPTLLYGQDPQFSQYYNHLIYYNPATTGMNRDLRINAGYRNLWSRVPGDFSTYLFTADYSWLKKRTGLGVLILNDNQGFNRLNTQRMEMLYSFKMVSSNNLVIQGGLSGSYNRRELRDGDFVFADQLDPIHGIVQQSGFVSQQLEPVSYLDANVGFVARMNSKTKRFTPTLGFSMNHIIPKTNISLIGDEAYLDRKMVIHGDVITRFTMRDRDLWKRIHVFLNPGFIYEKQGSFKSLMIGSNFDVYPLRLGMWFREQSAFSGLHTLNSAIMLIGVSIPVSANHDLLIDYTYDTTISKMEFSSGGAHEITLTYNIALPDRKGAVDCPEGLYEWWKPARGLSYNKRK